MKCNLLLLISILIVGCTSNNPIIPPNSGNEIFVETARRGGGGWFGPPYDDSSYIVNSDGSGEIQRPLPPGLDSWPEWSPNGEWIVFTASQTDKSSALYLVRFDGTHKIKLTDDSAINQQGVWSPDGKHIAYESTHSWDSSDISILDLECVLQNEECHPIPRFLVQGREPDWSPDGKQIVYAPILGQGWKQGKIFITNADGSSETSTLATNIEYVSKPKWSPDGKKIIFASLYDLYIMNVDGTAVASLPHGRGGENPQWSPDGNRITFVSMWADQALDLRKLINCVGSGCLYSDALFSMNVDGSDLKRLSKRSDESVRWYTWMHNNNNISK